MDMGTKQLLLILSLLSIWIGTAQRDSTIVLDEVILNDAKLKHFSQGLKVQVLTDSTIHRNGPSLTNVLQFNSNLYFKENGYGMVSSASFRGTNASQTAVIWNGININSQLNGQTDFNTLNPQNYNSVSVRSGGGSVQYGSGAVGGSILLNDSFLFEKRFSNTVQLGYGSFHTRRFDYGLTLGAPEAALNFGINYNASDNDYKYLGTDQRNENGEFENLNINASTGYVISNSQILKFYHTTFFGNRNFSGTLTAPSNDNYRDINSRTLVEWSHFNDGSVKRVKAAHLYERYRYYFNRERPEFTFGRSNTYILNYDTKYQFGDMTVNGIGEVNVIYADGSSIENATRNQISGTLLFSHELTSKFNYGLNIRKELVTDYRSPLLFSLDSKYQATQTYQINLNASKNFRIPTFNDLYWSGAGAMGNKDLVPESSVQAELGHTVNGKMYRVNFTTYYISSDNLIQWRPNKSGVFIPQNVTESYQYGAEFEFDLKKEWRGHGLHFNNLMAYTKSMDQQTKNQLIYVPEFKWTSNIAYQFKKWDLYYQWMYNGPVFTTTDNSEVLAGYGISNIGVEHDFEMTHKIKCTLGLKINNLLDKNYQNVAYRPMPNRNFNLQLITKF
ncbi:TonB-dependent receptor plug domain-containing protein [Sediminicola sp. 1XM1-17]|uniref:TonB-dependent receptor plug domain-containing protein n=1 Tax=Sediminicola sp. 1XM1-17 TaxID=3127702 RepID=UPI003076C01E